MKHKFKTKPADHFCVEFNCVNSGCNYFMIFPREIWRRMTVENEDFMSDADIPPCEGMTFAAGSFERTPAEGSGPAG